jgi:hypothetical protein
MLTPFGVLREPHIASGRKPGPGQRVSILDKQVSRRPAVRSHIEVRLHAEMTRTPTRGPHSGPDPHSRAGQPQPPVKTTRRRMMV